MDENDGYDSWLWPDVASFPSGTSAEQMRQIYGSLMQKVTTQMYKDENKRTYGLVRAANAGTTSFLMLFITTITIITILSQH